MQKSALFRKIPKIDDIITSPLISEQEQGHLLTDCARAVLDEIRKNINSGLIGEVPDFGQIVFLVLKKLDETNRPCLRKVINGTGIIIHTNLGRAPLAKEAIQAISQAALGYSNLEYDLSKGKRGSRHSLLGGLLTKLTGAEAAIIVNNNAAAVLLALSSVSFPESEIIVSRGELVEIGGSFRIPDICALSGSRLKEVGTTNKTHLQDYERAITPQTAAILIVHPSNFSMTGFVSKPKPSALAELACTKGIPLIEDLGSGCLVKNNCLNEKTVMDSITSGADIVTFSGDKLLGGPQAGIIAGKSGLIEKMKKHPLARVLRIDKLSLAALEANLRMYLDPKQAVKKIPVLKMLFAGGDELKQKASRLQESIGKEAVVVQEKSQAGGGALPGDEFTSYAVEFFSEKFSPVEIEEHFRGAFIPIIGRIRDDRFVLDVRTIEASDFVHITDRWKEIGL